MRILFIKMPLLMPISAVMVTDGVLDTTHSVFSKVLPLDLTTPSTCSELRCPPTPASVVRQLLADVMSPPLGA